LKGKIEMKFSYQNLKMAELGGDRVGNWKGFPVFASRRVLVDDKAGGAFFIVYDDDNVIVKRDNGAWYCYGQVNTEGQVEECSKRRYNVYAEPVSCGAAHAVCGKSDAECDGTAAVDANDEVIGDVKMGLDIDALLSSARTMTVDSLLEGFDYGLDAKG
jgi:hypothetical protein